MWDVERMRPLVQEWDEALRAEMPAYARLVAEAERRGSILRAAASEDEVAAAEARLGMRFPPSYRSFLLIADGANAGARRASRVLRHIPAEEAELLRVRHVIPFSEHEQLTWLMEMWRESLSEFVDRQQSPSADEPAQVFDFAPGCRALLITAPVQDGIVALVPFDGEWQVWEFFWEGVSAHQSFAAFIRYNAQFTRRRAAERADRARAAVPDGSDWTGIDAMAEQGDSRAVEAACRALLDHRHSHDVKDRVARTLMLIGDPQAIPSLRTALDRVDDPDFATPIEGVSPAGARHTQLRHKFALIEALDVCGDLKIVGEIERLASEPSALAEWAVGYLARRDQLPRW